MTTKTPALPVGEEVAKATYVPPEHGWTCFHCGETFMHENAARYHFGALPEATPGCLMRMQEGEHSLQRKIRWLEAENAKLLVLSTPDSPITEERAREMLREAAEGEDNYGSLVKKVFAIAAIMRAGKQSAPVAGVSDDLVRMAYDFCDNFIDENAGGHADNLDDGQWNEMLEAVLSLRAPAPQGVTDVFPSDDDFALRDQMAAAFLSAHRTWDGNSPRAPLVLNPQDAQALAIIAVTCARKASLRAPAHSVTDEMAIKACETIYGPSWQNFIDKNTMRAALQAAIGKVTG